MQLVIIIYKINVVLDALYHVSHYFNIIKGLVFLCVYVSVMLLPNYTCADWLCGPGVDIGPESGAGGAGSDPKGGVGGGVRSDLNWGRG